MQFVSRGRSCNFTVSLNPQDSCEESWASLGMECSVTASPAPSLWAGNVLPQLLPCGPARGVFGGSALPSVMVAAHVQAQTFALWAPESTCGLSVQTVPVLSSWDRVGAGARPCCFTLSVLSSVAHQGKEVTGVVCPLPHVVFLCTMEMRFLNNVKLAQII